MKISICIPCYEYKGYGKECLEKSFQMMSVQLFKDFQVVISDHSIDNQLELLCEEWKDKLNIKYYRNEENRGNPADNTNKAMALADGEWIQVLNQDDYLIDSMSLLNISYHLEGSHNWIASRYFHSRNRQAYERIHVPSINSRLYVVNTIGTPSCVVFRNIKPLMLMDTNLKYCYDCEYYYRFMQANGSPELISSVTIINYLWENSITAEVDNDFIDKENQYILKKHGVV